MRFGPAALAVLVVCLLGPGAAAAKPAPSKPATPKPLTLVAPTVKEPLAVPLARQEDGSLSGELSVAVRAAGAGELVAAYHPGGVGSKTGGVSLPPTKLKKGQVTDAAITFTLPKGAASEELNGTVVLQVEGKPAAAIEFGVLGAQPTLAGVSVQPEKVTIKLDTGTPFGSRHHTSTQIHLVGPGVPGLFAKGAAPNFSLLLHSSDNDTAQATVSGLKQTSDDAEVATATLNVDGDLGPGSFEGSAPISVGSPASPKLFVDVESGDSFVCALIVVLIGSFLGGGLYLASNRKRRKNLLRDRVKALLTLYDKKLKHYPEKDGTREIPVWSIEEYLGKDEADWYDIKTNAIVEFDGAVQTIWSAIHWARNEDDLNAVAAKVEELKIKIVRWVTAANAADKLKEASERVPTAPQVGTKEWTRLRTPHDTAELLKAVRSIELTDDAAMKSTIDRMQRQAHWHVAMAAVWNAVAVIEKAMETPGAYSPGDVNLVHDIGLEQLDSEGSPESSRDAAKQVHLELELAEKVRLIRKTFQGNVAKLEPNWERPTNADSTEVPLLVTAVMQPLDFERSKPDPNKVARPGNLSRLRIVMNKLRGPSATNHKGEAISPAIDGILRRDLAWTVATAIATAAVYVPTIFNSTWGTWQDYVGALAAGFVGKAAISWAGLPFFESLSTSGAAPAEPKKEAAQS